MKEILHRIQSLNRSDCIKLNHALRSRIHKLASSPDPVVARRVRSSKTATVDIGGIRATGTIIDRTSLCVLLQFQDRRTLFCNICELLENGFDVPITSAPDSLFSAEKADTSSVKTKALRSYLGDLYQLESVSGDLAQCRRLFRSPVAQALPVALLEPVLLQEQVQELTLEV